MAYISSISATVPTALYDPSGATVKAVVIDTQGASGSIRIGIGRATVSKTDDADKGILLPTGQIFTFTADQHGWLARGIVALGESGAVTGVVVEAIHS